MTTSISTVYYNQALLSARAASTANLTATYFNGVSGIGATLTNAGSLAAFALDGVTLSANDRVLIHSQTSAFENGVYTVTEAGSASVAWILTRVGDFQSVDQIRAGLYIPIVEGTANAGHFFVCQGTPGIVGTDNITFATIDIGTAEIEDGAVTNAKVSASAAIAFSKLASLASANILVGNVSNVATSVAMSGDATIANTGAVTIANDAITTAKILNANVTLGKLAAGITPSHVIKFSGRHTSVGGDATEEITVTGALATDNVSVLVHTPGVTPRTVDAAAAGTDNITVTLSGDPSNDHVLQYIVVRAAT